MPDFSPYLLPTDAAIREFKARHAADLEVNLQIYSGFIEACPLMEWVPFTRSGATPREIAFIVGILCVLHEERPRRCHFSFNQGAFLIRRDPADEEEWEQWCEMGKFGK